MNKWSFIVSCFFIFFNRTNLKACAPLTPLNFIGQSISGNNLLLDWESTSPWVCQGYTVEVELACINSAFSGTGPFYYSPELNRISVGPEAYPQQTISLVGLCPGQVYQYRAREVQGGVFSNWSSVFTFTTPGSSTPASLIVSSNVTTVCPGQIAQLSSSAFGCGSGPTNYTWLPASGLSCSSCASPVANVSVTTTFTCFTQGSQIACWSASNTIQITINTATSAGVASTSPSVCFGDVGTLVLSPPSPLMNWQSSSDFGNTWSAMSPSNVSSFATGSLTANTCFRAFVYGCGGSFISNSVCVTVFSAPQLTLVSNVAVACEGETVNITASGANTYSWNYGTSNGPLLSITPTATATYSVYGWDENGCGGSANFTQEVAVCTEMSDHVSVQHEMKIYPNPNGGDFTISGCHKFGFLILDGLGQTVTKGELDFANRYSMDIQNLLPGIYFITPASGEGITIKVCVYNY